LNFVARLIAAESRHVIETHDQKSVQPAGNRVRVRAQLIDARTDTHLWGERYDRPLDDVFAIQTDIAKAIADHLQAKLSPAEKAAMEQPPTADLVAYDRYLRAKKLTLIRTFDARERENNHKAIRLLEQAVAYDPAFLVAYCDLASAHVFLYFTGVDRTPARLALAEGALRKAVELAHERGEPHLAAAWIAYQGYRDYDRALAEVAIARQRLPNDPWVLALPGFIARRQGQLEQCTGNLERAIELDPRNLWLLLQTAQTYWLLRCFPDMARCLDRALAIIPGDASTRLARAMIDLEAHGDSQPAYDLVQNIVAEDPSAVEALAEQWIYLALCLRDPAEMARALAFFGQQLC